MRQRQINPIMKLKTYEVMDDRGNLVRKYIGEALAPFKFEYCGYQGDCWVFEKKFGRITQTICISPYRFDANMMTFELYTDARETGLVQAADIEGIESDNYEHGYWKYADNEESLRKVLNQMKEVLIMLRPSQPDFQLI